MMWRNCLDSKVFFAVAIDHIFAIDHMVGKIVQQRNWTMQNNCRFPIIWKRVGRNHWCHWDGEVSIVAKVENSSPSSLTNKAQSLSGWNLYNLIGMRPKSLQFPSCVIEIVESNTDLHTWGTTLISSFFSKRPQSKRGNEHTRVISFQQRCL